MSSHKQITSRMRYLYNVRIINTTQRSVFPIKTKEFIYNKKQILLPTPFCCSKTPNRVRVLILLSAYHRQLPQHMEALGSRQPNYKLKIILHFPISLHQLETSLTYYTNANTQCG